MAFGAVALRIERLWWNVYGLASDKFDKKSARRTTRFCRRHRASSNSYRIPTLSRNQSRNPRRAKQTVHPPVYCVEDLQLAPPMYRTLDFRVTAPSDGELRACRRRLSHLVRNQRALRANPGADGERAAYDIAVLGEEITRLTAWIVRLEQQGDRIREHHDDDPTARARDALLAHQPCEAGTGSREVFGQPREVRPQLLGDSSGLVLEADRGRFEALKAQKEERRRRGRKKAGRMGFFGRVE